MAKFRDLSSVQRALVLGAVVVILLVVLFALAEGAVRLRAYLRFGYVWGVEGTTMIDPDTRLRVPKPGATFGGISINSRGFRGPEIEEPRPPGTLRIAFLGGSTTYCAEVSSNDVVWPHLVWMALARAYPDVRFDYVNAGVSGFGVSASRRNLAHRVAPFDPDVIVIYHATNDLSGNSFDQAVAKGVASERSAKQMTWPSRYSLLWYLVEFNLRIMHGQAEGHEQVGKLDVDIPVLTQLFHDELSALVEESEAVASLVVVPTFSTQLRADQDAERQKEAAITSLFYMPYMTIDGLVESFAAYNDAIREVAREHGALLVDGENDIPGDAVHFKDSVHFTDAGSRAMAERVTRTLLASEALRALVERSKEGVR